MNAPALTVGERIIPFCDGVVYRVESVTEGAAYLRQEYTTPKEVTIGERTFLAHSGGSLLAISRTSIVSRLEDKHTETP